MAKTEVVEVLEDKPIDADKVARAKIIVRAFDMAGGVPHDFLKTTAVRVGSSAWRVNIWTATGDGFLRTNSIAHSFYIKE